MLCMFGNYSVVETPRAVGSNTLGILVVTKHFYCIKVAHESINEVQFTPIRICIQSV